MDKEDEEEALSNIVDNLSPELEPASVMKTIGDTEEEEQLLVTAGEQQCELKSGSLSEIGVAEQSQPAVTDECVDAVVEEEPPQSETVGVIGEVGDTSEGDGRLMVGARIGTEMDAAEAVEAALSYPIVEREAVKCMEMMGLEEAGMVKMEEDTGTVSVEVAPKVGDKGDRERNGGFINKDNEMTGDQGHMEITFTRDNIRIEVGNDGNDTETDEKTEVADAGEDAKVAGAAQDTKVADVGEDTEVSDVREDTKVSDVREDTEEADVEDDTEVADVEDDTEVADVEDGTEILDTTADASENTEVPNADNETEGGDTGEEDTELAGVEEDMEVASEGEETEAMDVIDTATNTLEAVVSAEAEEASIKASGKRKLGRNSKVGGRGLTRKSVGEDVCFICFDGGDLFLCDRRGCQKGYHPSCVNRDEAFFRAKGRWNCGWHQCSSCEKNAYYMCYTCTFSLCKGCIKDAVILCVRKNKGFCETCLKTVTMIESNEQTQVDFDDKSSWEYLFKDYWIDLKERLSITADEIAQAKNPWKGSNALGDKEDSPEELCDFNNDPGSGLDSSGNIEKSARRRKKPRLRTRSRAKEEDYPNTVTEARSHGASINDRVDWASNELLEFVVHMKDGDGSILSQFDVQELLLEYIKQNKLRDPRRKSQIICDHRLQNIFGKPRVAHFEMLKLLELHFLGKDDHQADDCQGGSVVDTEGNQSEAYGNLDVHMKGGKDKTRKPRRKGDKRGPQSNIDDYAAIDIHNINLIYLRRNLLEELLEDTESLHDKAVGAFVRIRIAGNSQKQDLYRLVQVVGTTKADETYKVGKRTTDMLLEILNLNKTEVVSIDVISNQEFTEDECKRLRQSIKCGLINPLTVGDVQEKAMALQAVRVKDWFESEIMRLTHLCDRASDLGRKKELRECVEKLQLLKRPEERQRRLDEFSEIHADPNMDPSHESDEDEAEDKKQGDFMRLSGYSRRPMEPISPQKLASASTDSWSETRTLSTVNREFSRNLSSKGDTTCAFNELMNEKSWNQGRDSATLLNSREKTPITASNSSVKDNTSVTENLSVSVSPGVSLSTPKTSETEKIWHYRDPSGKSQGPFSVTQLRKWNNTGYFPATLKIWRATESEDDSILLSDALVGKFLKEQPMVQTVHSPNLTPYLGKLHRNSLQQGTEIQGQESSNISENHAIYNSQGTLGLSGQSNREGYITSLKANVTPSVDVPDYSSGDRSTGQNRSDLRNLTSSIPMSSTPREMMGIKLETKWSPKSLSVKSAESLLRDNLNSSPGTTLIQQSSLPQTEEHNALENRSGLASENILSTSKPGVVVPSARHNTLLPSSTNARQIHSQPSVPSNLLGMTNAPLLSTPGASNVSINPSADTSNTGASVQNFVQPASTQQHQHRSAESQERGSSSVLNAGTVSFPPVNNQAWGNGPQMVQPNNQTPLPEQQPGYGQWSGTPVPVQNSIESFNQGNPAAMYPQPGFSGFPASNQPPNFQPSVTPNMPWSVGPMFNPNSTQTPTPGSQNSNWGPMSGNPNMVWGPMIPGNMNLGAPPQGPTPGIINQGWVAPTMRPAPGNNNGPPTMNTNAGWVVPGSGSMPINANMAWAAPGQGQVPGNPNPGWVAPSGDPVMWSGKQNQNQKGNNFTSQRDRSREGDSGYSGRKQLYQQSSFGSGGSSRPAQRVPRVCEYHRNGHCKKGDYCNLLHT